MKLRAFFASFLLSAWFGCNCGPTTAEPCASVKCSAGLVCDPDLVKCVAMGAGGGPGTGGGGGASATGGGSGGGAATGTCTPLCGASAPFCDVDNRCKICTATEGCGGSTPFCDPVGNGGLGRCVVCTQTAGCGNAAPVCDLYAPPNRRCVQCLTGDDCPVPGTLCLLDTNSCAAPGTGGGSGTGGGGGTGGGTAGTGGGGGTGGSGGTSTNPPIFFDDAGMTSRCFAVDAGPSQCTNECPKGYECISGQCKLRGSTGPVQATLRWNTQCDLDLYMVEPIPTGGTCEIFYGNPGQDPNAPPLPFPLPIPLPAPCSKGWLDLDANRACGTGDQQVQLTDRPVENIIYPRNSAPPRGTYTVRANNWSSCSVSSPIPYEVEVRANGVTRWFCGTFQTSDANGGGKGAGRVITTFTIP